MILEKNHVTLNGVGFADLCERALGGAQARPKRLRPKLMEIDGRFWGSLEVAIALGIDFPYLFYRLAVDGDV